MQSIFLLLTVAGGALLVMAVVTTLAGRDSINGIKSRTVGDGQYGTARWATDREVKTTYAQVPFRAAAWRGVSPRWFTDEASAPFSSSSTTRSRNPSRQA